MSRICMLGLLSVMVVTVVSALPKPFDRVPFKAVKTDVDKYPFAPAGQSNGLSMFNHSATFVSDGKHYVAHVAHIADPRFFRFDMVAGGCGNKAWTSTTAKQRDCTYATNGGFFDMIDGSCQGNVVINGTVDHVQDNPGANLGLTHSSELVVGYVSAEDLKGSSFGWRSLLQGAGWLVRDGKPHVNTSLALGEMTLGFTEEYAPRTMATVYGNGSLGLVVVDGQENIKYGATLWDMQELALDLGAVSALNLDGGGSSVAVYNGKWVSNPTCEDDSTPCERQVVSITCVSARPST